MVELLTELFSSRVRGAVLGHLLLRPHLRFSLTELSRRLDMPISSLQHECYKLEGMGLLIGRREGGSRRYHPDQRRSILPPLTQVVAAAMGPVATLRGALEGLEGLELAYIAGSDDAALPPPPIPPLLVLVGEIPLEALDAALNRSLAALGVGPGQLELAFYRPDDWHARIAEGNPLVIKFLAGSYLDVTPANGEAAPA
ncbi:MAG: hypothetical protein M3R06_05395 [Chloroflexota bacterium]|nr:hypothetical protein [Chloroflexota bacterium]